MNIIIKGFCILPLLLLSSCFHLKQKPYFIKNEGIKLLHGPRTDGYYYKIVKDLNDRENVYPIVFLSNGLFKSNVFINEGQNQIHNIKYERYCYSDVSIAELNAFWKTDCFLANYDLFTPKNYNFISKNIQLYMWGKYTMDNKNLIIRYYELDPKGNLILMGLEATRKDSSLIFYRKIDYETKTSVEINEIYHFREMDSINLNIPSRLSGL
ncbi:hypothetical protein [Galbibacter mesophilus]|uniref:hypothetical protein n=1 Tax=Galbibacter mesophilus TaxID=379069 RepID=UPI00191D554C|nr:hypothetical protein [Galbibacter mesophilus]MCM5663621.1 hypothetical protein [Galbibacter mesophilus]